VVVASAEMNRSRGLIPMGRCLSATLAAGYDHRARGAAAGHEPRGPVALLEEQDAAREPDLEPVGMAG
jgi:hypothetical protein